MKDDLISRQAAIAEIMEDIKDRSLHDDPGTPEDYAEGYDEGIRNASVIVLQMPSAQPGWIPCSERLPGEDESFYVLCCDKYGEIMIGNVFECYDGETPYSAESEYEYMYDCVAWMPLPKPWEGDANGKD